MSLETLDVKSITIETSLDDLKKFEQGSIWRDIKKLFGISLEGARDGLEFAGKGMGIEPSEMPYTTGYYQGKAAHARLAMDAVQLLIVAKEGEIEDARRKRDSSGN